MKNKGFTLIEILGVIIVIGILGVIIIPKLINTINESQENTYKISTNQLIEIMNRYALDKKAKLIPFDGCTINFQTKETDCTELEFTGKLPTSGMLYVNRNGTVSGNITFDNKTLYVSDNEIYENNSDIIREYTFNYTGEEQTFKVPKTGIYKLEVWGAQGGSYNETYHGGYGAYSTGTISLDKNQTLYVYIGGSPNNSVNINESTEGGYNGGGAGAARVDCVNNAGGGATHIALTSGLLSELEDKKNKIIIVAGGGGGNGYYNTTRNGIGGSAGGTEGASGYYSDNNNCESYGNGGTQNAPGTYYVQPGHYYNSSINIPTAGFGYGSAGDAAVGGSGGGGGYYGGRGTSCLGGGGGGSGYIGSLNDASMFCYGCTETNSPSPKTISTTGTSNLRDTTNCSDGYSTNAVSKCAKAGNGYAKITYIGQ